MRRLPARPPCPSAALISGRSHLVQAGDDWQCRLTGEAGMRSLPSDHLHATGAAPLGATVAPFEPVCLAAGLAIAAVPRWLTEYQSAPTTAIDLVLHKPGSRTWLSVLLSERSIGDLSDAEVLSLRHVAAGQLRPGRERGEAGFSALQQR